MTRVLLTLALVCMLPRLAAAQQPETIEYYAQDAIGSIRVVFNPAGTVLARQDYAPFGRQLFTVPAMPKEGFGGQEKDDETDQSYFHARMFQARAGRFTQPDPLRGDLTNPQGLNRYAYALNSPATVTDFSGLCPAGYFCSGVIGDMPGSGTGGMPGDGRGMPFPGRGGTVGDDTFVALDDPWTYAGGGGDGGWGGTGDTGDTGTIPISPTDPTEGQTTPGPPTPVRPTEPGCPTVPLAPRTASLRSNIAEALMAKAAFQGSTLNWFYDKVKNARGRRADVLANRSWDYKQLGREYGDFINFNYGATGQAAGIGYRTVAAASAFAHTQAHRLNAFNPSNLLNEFQDQAFIARGFSYAANGCR